MITFARRAVGAVILAWLTAVILRIFGGDGSPPQRGGWREVAPEELT